jgi:hypothetical protein
VEEAFGWPISSDYPNDENIEFEIGSEKAGFVPGESNRSYTQSVATLRRYYYELKIADFYSFRDELAQQFVVLKGAREDYKDIRNAKLYGLVDAYEEKEDKFRFAQVYLRESKFLEFKKGIVGERRAGEETNLQDPSRRVYYAILDRIDMEDFNYVAQMGYEITDTLKYTSLGGDESTQYGLVLWGVDDASGFIKAEGKTVSARRVHLFALDNMNYQLYRRLNSIDHDNAEHKDGEFDLITGADKSLDAPKVLRIYSQYNQNYYLFEDAISSTGYNQKAINFLGRSHIIENFEDSVSLDGLKKFNYNLFIDTAYINRGTGPIKPQYLIAVGVKWVDDSTDIVVTKPKEGCCDEEVEYTKIRGQYHIGRYLVNATDSARFTIKDPSGNYDYTVPRNSDYIENGTWDRLVFVPAIHDYKTDRLYILSEVLRKAPNWASYRIKDLKDGSWRYDMDVLDALVEDGTLTERTPTNQGVIGAFYQFGNWENNHNDVTFSLRFTKRGVENADITNGRGGSPAREKEFYIESETTNRTPRGNKKIAPVMGGWIKFNNNVAVLSRTTYEDEIQQAEVFNLTYIDGKTIEDAVVNEGLAASDVKVIAGVNEISILNAGGKYVTVSNLLGQTIARTVLSSDKATINVPKGIAIVKIDGEKTVKAVVK